MKKIASLILSLIVLVVVADLGAAYFIGAKAKQKFEELIAFANENHVLLYEVASYQQGIIKSDAVIHIKPRFSNDTNKFLVVKQTIHHGPIILGASKEKFIDFQLAAVTTQPLELPPQIQAPFTTYIVFRFDGDIEAQTIGTAFIFKDPVSYISGPGWSSKIHITKNGTTRKGDFIIPELTVQIMGAPIIVKDIKLMIDQNRSSFDNWLGNISFGIGNISQKEQRAELANLNFEEKLIQTDQTIEITWSLDFSKLSAAALSYGPLQFKMQFANIDPEGLKLLTVLHGAGKIEVDKNKQEEIFQKILLRRPKFTVLPSHLTLPQGDIKIDAELAVGGPGIKLPLDQGVIANTADGYFHAVVPKDILRQGLLMGISQELAKDPEFDKKTVDQKKQALDQQLDLKIQRLIQDGIMKESEKEYELKISIAKGKWIVNGKEVEIKQMGSSLN
jgi:uncharacterized protein YdgA (DUF945 family)